MAPSDRFATNPSQPNPERKALVSKALEVVRAHVRDRRRYLHDDLFRRSPEEIALRRRLRRDLRPADLLDLPADALEWVNELGGPEVFFALEYDEGPRPLNAAPPGTPDTTVTDQNEQAKFWEEAFDYDRKTVEDLHPLRVRVVWRFVREILRVFEDRAYTSLSRYEPDDQYEDPWLDPRVFKRSRTPAGLYRANNLIRLIHGQEMSLLPPPAPSTHLEYDPGDPEQDPDLHLYLSAFAEVTNYLGVVKGSKLEPEQGQLGLRGLLNPYTVRLLFPTRFQVMAFEEVLVEETLEKIVKKSPLEARKHLTDAYGLVDDEIKLLIDLAKEHARRATLSSIEDERAVMTLQLEDYVYRSREAANLKAEIDGQKQLAIVKGISRAEPDDIFTEFARVVDSAARRTVEGRAEPLQIEGAEESSSDADETADDLDVSPEKESP